MKKSKEIGWKHFWYAVILVLLLVYGVCKINSFLHAYNSNFPYPKTYDLVWAEQTQTNSRSYKNDGTESLLRIFVSPSGDRILIHNGIKNVGCISSVMLANDATETSFNDWGLPSYEGSVILDSIVFNYRMGPGIGLSSLRITKIYVKKNGGVDRYEKTRLRRWDKNFGQDYAYYPASAENTPQQ